MCDPTWEVCDTATATDPVAAPMDDSTAVPTDPATASGSKFPLIYAVFSLWMIGDAAIITNAYNSWVTDVIAAKVTNNTLWTTSYVNGANPVKAWFTAATT
jgi:hypothetical protein